MAGNDSIRAALEGLRQTEQKMKNVAGSVERSCDILRELSLEIQGVWEGDARDRFCKSSEELICKASGIAEQIQDRSSQLADSVAVYERTERETQNMVEDLSVENIFSQ